MFPHVYVVDRYRNDPNVHMRDRLITFDLVEPPSIPHFFSTS